MNVIGFLPIVGPASIGGPGLLILGRVAKYIGAPDWLYQDASAPILHASFVGEICPFLGNLVRMFYKPDLRAVHLVEVFLTLRSLMASDVPNNHGWLSHELAAFLELAEPVWYPQSVREEVMGRGDRYKVQNGGDDAAGGCWRC
ncbi:hypothetical protein BCR39DRAFT_541790 [Naematelia encephala]|uniref:Uncharacterized protein n=1 Tax=Naematelia encephala TaxID=71784 RepID=A0A1Y2AUQ1_9TREE|nr:hypothetical protein BCR39DRAFT_541790 [Naematelia encephala]